MVEEDCREVVLKVKGIAANTNRFGILKRVAPVMNEREKADFKRKSIQIDQLRAPSKVIDLAYKALNNDLPTSDYPFVGGEPLGVSRKPRNEKQALLRRRDPNAGKLILFVVGGLTRGEVYGLQALEKELANEQLIVGSTEISSGQQFIENTLRDREGLETAEQGIEIEDIKVDER